ncbi:hypothetical protein MLD52_09195 [Puniceicoccaceae bacterium K14]|nr:hypothetical protein [Puniceicoccaceae bacterium K14]
MADKKEIVDILLKIREDQAERKRLLNGFIEMQTQVNKLQGSLEKTLNNQYGGGLVKGLLTATGITVGLNEAFQATKRFVERGIDFSATIEQNQVAFETLLGGADEAQTRVAELVDFAAVTPFRFAGVVDANRQLQVLTDGALATTDGLRIVGDAAAATGRDFSQVAFWVGRVYAGLKSGEPIGEATLRLIEMGLISGETSRELQRLATSSHSADDAFQIIERTFENTSGAMEKQSRTFKGLSATVADTLDVMASDLTRPIFDHLKNTMEEVLELIGALPSEVEVARKKLRSIGGDVVSSIDNLTNAEDLPKTLEEVSRQMDIARKKANSLELALRSSLEVKGFQPTGNEQTSLAGDIARGAGNAAIATGDALKSLVGVDSSPYSDESIERTREITKNLRAVKSALAELEFREEQLQGLLGPRTQERIDALEERIQRLNETGQRRLSIGSKAELVRADATTGLLKTEENRLRVAEEQLRIVREGITTKIEENALAKEEETRLNTAKTRNSELLEGSQKIIEAAVKAADAYELQNGSLEEQQGRLQERLTLLGLEQETELENLKLLGEQAAIDESNAEFTVKRLDLVKQIEAVAGRIQRRDSQAADKAKSDSEKIAREEKRLERERLRAQRENFDTQELSLRLVIDRIQHERQLLELNGVTADERRKQGELLEAEQLALAKIIALKREELSLASTPREKVTIETEIQNLEQESVINERSNEVTTRAQESQEAFDTRGDPDVSFQNLGEARLAALQDYVTQAGTLNDNFYQSLLEINNTLESSIAESIEGLILGTESWGEALQNIAATFGTSIVQSIAQMAAKWITSRIAMAAVDNTLRAQSTAASAAEAGTLTATWAAPAALASVGSYGSALAFIPLMLAAVAGAVAAFETGGGIDGGEQLIRVNEKGREFVINNPTLIRFGEQVFKDMQSGKITPQNLAEAGVSSGGTSFASSSPRLSQSSAEGSSANNGTGANEAAQSEGVAANVNVGVFGTKEETMNWLKGQEGEKVIVDTFNRNSEVLSKE